MPILSILQKKEDFEPKSQSHWGPMANCMPKANDRISCNEFFSNALKGVNAINKKRKFDFGPHTPCPMKKKTNEKFKKLAKIGFSPVQTCTKQQFMIYVH